MLEPLELDPLGTEAVYQELDRRGIELLVEPEREAEPEPPPKPAPVAQPLETTTDALQLFLREAGRRPLALLPRPGGQQPRAGDAPNLGDHLI